MSKRVTLTEEDKNVIRIIAKPVLKDSGDYATSGTLGKAKLRLLLDKLGIEYEKTKD
jgi:hypothetical protein